MNNLIQNAVKIYDADKDEFFYLISTHRHHFNVYDFKDGSYVACDGGTDYCRRVQSIKETFNSNNKIEDFCLGDKDSFDVIKDKLLWGHRGKSGKEELKHSPIKNLTLEHLLALIEYDKQNPINPIHKKVIEYWIEYKAFGK